MSCCPIDQLCDRCLDEWAHRFHGVCYSRACTWVAELAARRRGPWVPWPEGSARVHAVAVGWVEDLTHDERLRDRLALQVERVAAERWAEKTNAPLERGMRHT